jgi:hypothetical protein
MKASYAEPCTAEMCRAEAHSADACGAKSCTAKVTAAAKVRTTAAKVRTTAAVAATAATMTAAVTSGQCRATDETAETYQRDCREQSSKATPHGTPSRLMKMPEHRRPSSILVLAHH